MAKVQRVTQLTLIEFGKHAEDPESPAKALTPQEVRERSLAARQMYEADEIPDYAETYHRLLNAGWTWRIALYVAWATMPKPYRVPRTQEELATEYLGLSSDRVISEWRRKYSAIDQIIADLQAEALLEYRPAAFHALGKVASQESYRAHNDRRLLFQMTGDFTPRQEVDVTGQLGQTLDLSELSEKDLARLSAEEAARRLAEAEDD